MRRLHTKLKRLKADLKIFNQTHFGGISLKVAEKRKELAGIQVLLMNNVNSSELIELEKSVNLELHDLLLAEEWFYKQKARVNWINEGDQNTKFFQKTVAANQSRNTIKSLTTADGVKLTTFTQISEEAVSFFQKLIGTVDTQVIGCPRHILEEILHPILSIEEAADIGRPISDAEIKAAMFSIGSDKAPGPDGFSSCFFKAAWSIVGADVRDAVLHFFHTGSLISAFNSTSIALVPKSQNSTSIKDYKPISCCSVVYKCITKILSNRIKHYMPKLIGKNQSAFVPGRCIADNVLLAQEMVRGYARKTLSPRCAIKVDLQKAFDSLDWGFLFEVLSVLQFPAQFIEWIRGCFQSAKFSISLNGGLVGYFSGARGVRQGDPLSPYLFVIVMNVLSKLLDAAAQYGVFSYHPKCKKIKLTHLCFADDLLIFSKGNLESVTGILRVLQLFYSFSGLQLNSAKTELFHTGVHRHELDEIQQATGFKLGILPVRYLGVPLITRRLSAGDCAVLVEKITARINSWTSKYLSYAGRLQLIQSILFSIQNYWCRQFMLPKGVLKEINQRCSRFFWKGANIPSKGARVSWSAMCYPKAEGGLGIKDIFSWNKACIVQNIWSILTQAGSLWIAWIEAYVLKGRSIWNISVSSTCSWNWRKILQLRDLAYSFVERRNDVEVWRFHGSKYSAAMIWNEIRPKMGKKE